MVKLTVIHESDTPESKLIGMVSNGWPLVLASLKSLLETGESLEATRKWPGNKTRGERSCRGNSIADLPP
jgi:hypothetical protein